MLINRNSLNNSIINISNDIEDIAVTIKNSSRINDVEVKDPWKKTKLRSIIEKDARVVLNVLHDEYFNKALLNLYDGEFLPEEISIRDFEESLKVFSGGLAREYIANYSPNQGSEIVPKLENFLVVFEWLDNVILESARLLKYDEHDPLFKIINDTATNVLTALELSLKNFFKIMQKAFVDLIEYSYRTANDDFRENQLASYKAKNKTYKRLGLSQKNINAIKDILALSPAESVIWSNLTKKGKQIISDLKKDLKTSTNSAINKLFDKLYNLRENKESLTLNSIADYLTFSSSFFDEFSLPQMLVEEAGQKLLEEQEVINWLDKLYDFGVDFDNINRKFKSVLHYLRPDTPDLQKYLSDLRFELSFDRLDGFGKSALDYINN